MEIQFWTEFFMWCTIINGGLLLLWVISQMVMPNLLYKTQVAFFPMAKEKFTPIFYLFLGIFKVFFIFFNAVPFVVLLIIG